MVNSKSSPYFESLGGTARVEQMQLRQATTADIPQLCELLGYLFAQEAEFAPDRDVQSAGLQEIVEHPERGRILVLQDGPLVVGMVNLLFTTSTALGGRVAILEDMVVRPERRGGGVGSELLRGAIDQARSLDCRRITLLTDGTNMGAQRFYARHGFSLSKMVPLRLVL